MSGHVQVVNAQGKRAANSVSKNLNKTVSVGAYLQAATAAHQAGRLEEAKAAYQAILAAQPDNVDALQLLGVLTHQQGDSKGGIFYLERAVALDPKNPSARNNIAGVLRALDQREAAEGHYAAARRLAPNDLGARLNHAVVLYELDRYDEAGTTFRSVLKSDPSCIEAERKLAYVALKLGRHDVAESRFRELLQKCPDHAEDLTNLAIAIHYQGRVEEAMTIFQRAVALAEEGSELSHNLRTFLHPHERTEEMRAQFREALRQHPKLWASEVGIAVNLIERGLKDAGQQILDDILSVHADEAIVWCDIGAMFLNAGKGAEARPFFQKAIKLDPALHVAYGNLGSTYMSMGDARAAVQLFRQALKVNPSYVMAQVSMTRALRDLREFDQAHLFGRAALDMPNFSAEQLPGMVQLFNSVCDFESLDRLGSVWDICDKLKVENLPIIFLDLLVFARSKEDIKTQFNLVTKWAANVQGAAAQAPLTTPYKPSSDGRLRIGILSSDLRSHSVTRFLKPLLEHYDRSKISIYCYSPLRSEGDLVQEKIKKTVDRFTYVESMTLREIAEIIRGDGVDILLELNGFTQGTRLGALAYKPAPVQMSWIGYPFTCGMKAIDYVVMDRFVAPTDESTLVETPLIMPDAWLCFGKFKDIAIDPIPPMERNGFVTFGTLNNPYKFDRETIAMWGKVMAQVPNSRFLMVRPEASSMVLCRNIANEFAKQGVGADRFFLIDNYGRPRDHLDYYNDIDISLDTFPVTGGTTTCEALWMGVPVVTLVGEAFHQRVSYSMLMQCGLDELCTFTPEDFVARATSLVNDREKLKEWRTSLRDVMSASPLCDEPRFLHQFQDMLEQVAKLHGLR